MTTKVALKLSKKYKSVRLYLHWPNVPTLTLNNHYVGWTVILNFLLFDTDNYVPYFIRKLEKMSQNLLSVTVVIGALKVNTFQMSLIQYIYLHEN